MASLIGLFNCPNRYRVYDSFKNLIELGQITPRFEEPLEEVVIGITSSVLEGAVVGQILLTVRLARTKIWVEEST